MRTFVISTLLAGVLILFWSGCASGPVTPEKAPEPKTEKIETAEPEMKKVTEDVQLVAKRSSYYSDGVLASYSVYTYADEGTEKREEVMYNSGDEVEERIKYTYEKGNLIESRVYNGDGELQYLHQYAYNDSGLLSEDKLLDPKGELQTRQTFDYNRNGNKTKWSVYNGAGALHSYSIYEYKNGLNYRIENYSAAGDLMDYFVIEYNADENPVKRTWYSGSDELEETRAFEYENGALEKETVFRANGSVKRYIEYLNNSYDNPVEVVFMDGSEDIQEQVTYEYINRTRVYYQAVE
jgi:hypothetical protein